MSVARIYPICREVCPIAMKRIFSASRYLPQTDRRLWILDILLAVSLDPSHFTPFSLAAVARKRREVTDKNVFSE